jgi:peptidoglycan/xylan/chitin deacetylase (PgdA/CDA1 family)
LAIRSAELSPKDARASARAPFPRAAENVGNQGRSVQQRMKVCILLALAAAALVSACSGASAPADESAGDVAKLPPLPPLPDAPPVLEFHDICPDACAPTYRYGVAHAEFQRMMGMLQADGYTAITPSQYVGYLRSDGTGLPERPILLTFDDSMASAYRGADAILQATGMRATMFVITSRPDVSPASMSWSEIAAAQASGRWDIQLHAHKGHDPIPVTIDGVVVRKSFYAYEKDGETFAQWKARAEGDISTGVALLQSHVPGYQPVLFACPGGNYGQQGTNDPAIQGSLLTFLTGEFGAWFGNAPGLAVVGRTADMPRYPVFNDRTAESLLDTLRRAADRPPRRPPPPAP